MSAGQAVVFATGVLAGAVILILAIWRLRRMAVEARKSSAHPRAGGDPS